MFDASPSSRYGGNCEGAFAEMLTWRPAPPAVRKADSAVAGSQAIDLGRSPGFPLGPIMVQPSSLQIEGDGTSTTTEPRIMQVLVALASASGAVVSRDALIDSCWEGRAVSDDAINRCIVKLRRLGSEFRAFEIETVPRVGYRLSELPGDGATPAHASRPRRILLAALAIAVIAALAGALYWRTAGEPRRPTIAILPFTPLNADVDTRNYGESFAATIGNALAQTGATLPDGDIRTIRDARDTDAALIVSGTVRREGSNYLVTARVDSARDGTTLLTNEFQADSNAAATLPAQVAAWLVPPVRMWSSFLPVERDAATTDAIMRIFLTRANGEFLRAWGLSRGLARAKPGSGSAQLVLALLTSDVLPMIAPDQRRAAIVSARSATESAAKLLPKPSRALAVRDCHLVAPGWQVLTPICDARNRAAIADDPDIPLLPFLFADQLMDTGRFSESASLADMDLAQNPLGVNQLILRNIAARMANGHGAEAAPDLEARLRRYGGPSAVAYVDFQTAIANADMRGAETILDDPQSGIVIDEAQKTTQQVLRALNSNRPDAAAVRTTCKSAGMDQAASEPFVTCLVALTLVGDRDAAFALADRGYRDLECCTAAQQEAEWLATGGEHYPRWQLFGKAMAPLRADRRFIELARRTGLIAYWESGHPPDFCAFERAPVCDLLKQARSVHPS